MADKLRYTVHRHKGLVVFIIGVMVLTCIHFILFPSLTETYAGHDISFHLTRMESYFHGVKEGHLFPKVTMGLGYGYGYAVDLFYPSILLLPYALFRLLGVSQVLAYNLYILVTTIATYSVMYFTMNRMTQSKLKSLMAGLFYANAVYRLQMVYLRSSLGEFVAYIFIPLVFLGLYYLRREDKRSIIYLTVGMSLIISTHFITTFIVFITILMIVCIKLIRREVTCKKIAYLVLAGVLTLLLCSYIIFPYIEQHLFMDYRYTIMGQLHVYGELGFTLFKVILGSLLSFVGPNGQFVPHIGFIGLIVIIRALFNYKKLSELHKILVILTVILLILSGDSFIWTVLKDSPISVIQFPYRFLGIVSYSVSILLTETLSSYYYKLTYKKYQRLFMVLLTIILLVYPYRMSLNPQMVYTDLPITVENQHLGGGKEYLPVDVDDEMIMDTTPYQYLTQQEGLSDVSYTITGYNQRQIGFKLDKNQHVILPFNAYKGYTVIQGDNTALPLTVTDGFIGVDLDKGSHDLTVQYTGTPIQKLTKWVSFLTVLIGSLYYLVNIYR